jgi:hypothetical protein
VILFLQRRTLHRTGKHRLAKGTTLADVSLPTYSTRLHTSDYALVVSKLHPAMQAHRQRRRQQSRTHKRSTQNGTQQSQPWQAGLQQSLTHEPFRLTSTHDAAPSHACTEVHQSADGEVVSRCRGSLSKASSSRVIRSSKVLSASQPLCVRRVNLEGANHERVRLSSKSDQYARSKCSASATSGSRVAGTGTPADTNWARSRGASFWQ